MDRSATCRLVKIKTDSISYVQPASKSNNYEEQSLSKPTHTHKRPGRDHFRAMVLNAM